VSEEYDSAKDAHDSYYAAVEAKRLRGLTAIRREVQIGSCRLILGDMNEVLPALGAFDLCLTDPPYGIGESNEKNLSRGTLAAPKDYGTFDWDQQPATAEQMEVIRACSRHQIIFGGNYFDLPPTSCWLVWDKQNGENDFADCELAWTNLQKAVRRIYWRWNGMIRKGSDVREHPTQKPVGVMEWCLEHVPAAKTVVDPFAGSGTTGVACVRRGLAFTGIERHEPYFDIMCRRIEAAQKQPDMFIETARVPEPTQEAFL
jgi:DNA modification methylase